MVGRRRRPIWAIPLFAVTAAGCCGSYEDDLEKLCHPKTTCPEAYAQGRSSAEGEARLHECLAKNVRSEKGRALMGPVLGTPGPESAARLESEAKSVGITECPYATELMFPVPVPPAPAGCEAMKINPGMVGVAVSESQVSALDGTPLVSMSSRETWPGGFDKRYKRTNDSLEVVPIRQSLAEQTKLARSKGLSAPAAYLHIAQGAHPLPQRMKDELVQSVLAGGVQQVRQVYVLPSGQPCSVECPLPNRP